MKETKKRLKVRQEKFAQLVAQGLPATRAYVEAGYADKWRRGANANAVFLLKQEHVAARVAEIREMAAGLKDALMTIVEKRIFLAEVIRTAIGSIGPDSRLCQEFYEKVEEPREGEDGKVVVRRRVRMVDKLRAIELDSKLAGHFAAKEDEEKEKAAAEAAAEAEAEMAERTREIAERVRKVLPVLWATARSDESGGDR